MSKQRELFGFTGAGDAAGTLIAGGGAPRSGSRS